VLPYLYSSPNIKYEIYEDEMGGACSKHGDDKWTCDFGLKTHTKTFGRPTRRPEDNIKINLRKIGWKGVGWIRVAQERVKRQALVET
jgi:hypothetical protein